MVDRADLEALIEEARKLGRADALAELRVLWRDAYLEAAREPEPAPVDGSAWWVYCVIVAGDPAPADVDVVTSGDLAALVKEVPLAEYNDDRLRQNLEDLAWVERVARAHEAVLESAMTLTTIVPLRLCTICLTRERVAALLDEQREALHASFERLRGRTEWGVKVFAEHRRFEAPQDSEETAYLERKRRARAARDDAQRAAMECAQRVHEAVERQAIAARVNPPQHAEAHGRDADMLLNAAYLVDEDGRAELHELIAALAAELGPQGFVVELTGPWPPYNFVAPTTPALS